MDSPYSNGIRCALWVTERLHLEGFSGYLLTDSLGAYDQVRTATTRPILVGCWSHARRYFHDLIKARPKTASPGLADEALSYIGALFHLERRWTEVTVAQRQALRQRHSAPLLEQFKAWLDRHLQATAPKMLLGKAIRYTLRVGGVRPNRRNFRTALICS